MLKFLLFLFLQLFVVVISLGKLVWRIFVDFKIKGIWSYYLNYVRQIYNEFYGEK